MPSFSRPSVSDDNAYAESLFRTLKYNPSYPRKPFADIAAARLWVQARAGLGHARRGTASDGFTR